MPAGSPLSCSAEVRGHKLFRKSPFLKRPETGGVSRQQCLLKQQKGEVGRGWLFHVDTSHSFFFSTILLRTLAIIVYWILKLNQKATHSRFLIEQKSFQQYKNDTHASKWNREISNQWERVNRLVSKEKGAKGNLAEPDPSLLSLFGLVKSLGPGAEPIRKGLKCLGLGI